MKKLYKIMSGACLCMLAAPSSVFADTTVENFMAPATMEYPAGFYSSMAPSSVDITWDNQAFELVDPKTDANEEEYVEVLVALGDASPVSVNAYQMYLPGFDDLEEEYLFDIALYDLDDLWSFDGNTIVVTVPEGVVVNNQGLKNPKQEFTFHIMPTCQDYTLQPVSGTSLKQDEAVLTLSFEDGNITYNEGYVAARVYDPYMETALNFGKEVTIKGYELVVNMTSLEPGDYEVVIPEGFLFVEADGEKYISPDIWVEYTIEAGETGIIKSIQNAYGDSSVYNMQGVKVTSGRDKNLAPGIYVVKEIHSDGKVTTRKVAL